VLHFIQEAHVKRPDLPFYSEPMALSLLSFTSYDEWWKGLHFKVRNKVRKAEKTGVVLRTAKLDDDFVRGVQGIYNEWPIRQGRKFWHYGKNLETIKRDLSSFPECTSFIGAYHNDELIGFMKLFAGDHIVRTVHIISKLSHRDKCVMDAFIAKGVKVCDDMKISNFHYGDWTSNSLGVFRQKFGFAPHDCRAYFAPLNWRGQLALNAKLHRSLRERLPQPWIEQLAGMRAKYYTWKYGTEPVPAAT
jgi:diadenosine tetraphosphatase ApaH/serine/threonine PP2A family protein phosphatase